MIGPFEVGLFDVSMAAVGYGATGFLVVSGAVALWRRALKDVYRSAEFRAAVRREQNGPYVDLKDVHRIAQQEIQMAREKREREDK